MPTTLTYDQFIRVLPKAMKKSVNPKLIKNINEILQDPLLGEHYRDNLLGYANVCANGKFKIESYVNAVRYVSFKMMGSSNVDAYTKTFPAKYQRFTNQGLSQRDLGSYVSAFNKTKLVTLIFEQTLIPTHIFNADIYQRAINIQAELMMNARSEKVRSDAANSLITHLKAPEVKKIELDITHKEDKSIEALRQSTMELVAQQQKMIQSKTVTAENIAHSNLLIEGEIEEAILVE